MLGFEVNVLIRLEKVEALLKTIVARSAHDSALPDEAEEVFSFPLETVDAVEGLCEKIDADKDFRQKAVGYLHTTYNPPLLFSLAVKV